MSRTKFLLRFVNSASAFLSFQFLISTVSPFHYFFFRVWIEALQSWFKRVRLINFNTLYQNLNGKMEKKSESANVLCKKFNKKPSDSYSLRQKSTLKVWKKASQNWEKKTWQSLHILTNFGSFRRKAWQRHKIAGKK